ncbi:dihydroorotase family protein [Candidatus Roizmanbacteria bacterium]|nr:dihydroorotase family protein [Candidatus Roizmanbacteria bacterium]
MALLTLPGLIDMHVHLRDPGQTWKEDFYTGTAAALAGGFTTVFDMPNNEEPIISVKRLNRKIKEAKKKIVCDVGFYGGAVGSSFESLKGLEGKVFGPKLYLNVTTGGFMIDVKKLEQICHIWHARQPILIHAEGRMITGVIDIVKKTSVKTHVCHVSGIEELKPIIKAKEEGLPLTCGVTPHHLFLNERDLSSLGPYGVMKPPLKSKKDQEFLWRNLKYIDVVESDHAPHTRGEKESENPPFGVPGLETTLPLLLSDKRITIGDVVRLCYKNPKKILGVKTDRTTKVVVDTNSQFIIHNSKLHTKCAWSPFHGWKARGKVRRVYIRERKVFEDGKVLVKRGFGKVMFPSFNP